MCICDFNIKVPLFLHLQSRRGQMRTAPRAAMSYVNFKRRLTSCVNPLFQLKVWRVLGSAFPPCALFTPTFGHQKPVIIYCGQYVSSINIPHSARESGWTSLWTLRVIDSGSRAGTLWDLCTWYPKPRWWHLRFQDWAKCRRLVALVGNRSSPTFTCGSGHLRVTTVTGQILCQLQYSGVPLESVCVFWLLWEAFQSNCLSESMACLFSPG